jgi:transcriptional regulator with XRE-family HTH domain
MTKGKDIRAMREAVGMRQIALAKESGIDRSKLSNVENGYTQLRDDELAAIQRVIAAAAQSKAKQIGKLAEMAV